MNREILPPTIGQDIRSAIADLDAIRTQRNRDAVVWAQYVLTACAVALGEAVFTPKKKGV